MRMHGSALRCVRSDDLIAYATMLNSTLCKYKTVKDIEKLAGIIMPRSRVVVQNRTEIRSPILGGQIGEVLVFLQTHTNKFFQLDNSLNRSQIWTEL